MKAKSITYTELHEYLDYEPDTGIFRWKKLHTHTSKVKVGDIAGTLTSEGYCRIKLFGKSYKRSRLAWFYTHGEWPKPTIHHLNKIRNDDRLSNLIPANFRIQRIDKSTPRSKFGLPKWVEKRKKKFRARVDRVHLGLYPTMEEAHEVAKQFAKERYGEFFTLD